MDQAVTLMVIAASASNVASQFTQFCRVVDDVNTIEDRKDVFNSSYLQSVLLHELNLAMPPGFLEPGFGWAVEFKRHQLFWRPPLIPK